MKEKQKSGMENQIFLMNLTVKTGKRSSLILQLNLSNQIQSMLLEVIEKVWQAVSDNRKLVKVKWEMLIKGCKM
jgi:hypothetical protein